MDDVEKRNILKILDKVIDALKRGDMNLIKSLSNQTIHDATVYQEEHFISLAVLIYSLSKVHERELYFDKFKGWKNYCVTCHADLKIARDKLIKGDFNGFNEALKSYLSALNKVDPKLKLHIQDVFKKARVNKASRIYEHGISMEATAKLLGISMWELAEYTGNTGIGDVDLGITMPEKQRIKIAMEMF